MKNYPHRPSEEFIKEKLRTTTARYNALIGLIEDPKQKTRPEFFLGLCELKLDSGALIYAFDGEPSVVLNMLRDAAQHIYQAALLGLKMDPHSYMLYLALANVVLHDELLVLLQDKDREGFTHPEVQSDEAFYDAADAMRFLSAGKRREAGIASNNGISRLQSGQVNQLAVVALEAILSMEHAIAAQSESGLSQAIASKHAMYVSIYSRRAMKNYPSGLLDIRGLGLLRIASASGLSVASESVYLPLALCGSR